MENLNQSSLLSICRNQLSKLSEKKILLAYSGGEDSSVLLDCLYKISKDESISIRTIHVNHGLSIDALKFENHCLEVTSQLNISHQTINVSINSSSNIEEKCRDKRYKVLVENCKHDEIILTGHHEEDQVETFLLRLIRGSGARGLSSMKKSSKYLERTIFRPFLKVPKIQIHDYSTVNNISFIQDESNKSDIFDRNFIRHNIIPLLKERWPSINKNILNNISVQEIQSRFINDHIKSILPNFYLKNHNKLSVYKLNQEELYTKIMIIHEWVFLQTGVFLKLRQIHEILKILKTSNDSNPLFAFSRIKITKNRDILEVSIIKT